MSEISLDREEILRQEAVETYDILDTLPEKSYDDITKIATMICDTPVSLISILDKDRQFFKSRHGIDIQETSRDISFCTHAVKSEDDVYTVSDAREHPLFANNPLVKGDMEIVFYAGVPLMTKDNYALGTLCVFDHKPRTLSSEQKTALKALADQVMTNLELRRQNLRHEELELALQEKNLQLKDFAGVVSHDMKMPLANIITTTDILKSRYQDLMDDKGRDYLNYLKNASFTLSDYIQDILTYYQSDELVTKEYEEFYLNHLLEEIEDLLNYDYSCEISYLEEDQLLRCNRAALHQILINLIGNSIKYNDKKQAFVNISLKQNEIYYLITVEDNGMGIPKDKQEEIFNLFAVVADQDKNGRKGNGIGLSTVQKIVHKLGGEINVESEEGQGSKFSFTIRKNYNSSSHS